MKVLFDINHPAHVHFFRVPAQLLIAQGHQVIFTSRDKDVTIDLLNELGFEHVQLSSMGKSGILSLGAELISRNLALYKTVKSVKPDIMAAIGGTFIAHVSMLTRVPSLVFYDTENAKLQNLITYPFASCVLVPACYQAWLPKKHQRYAGYHELSYLHPAYFTPERSIALASGLVETQKNIFIRLVSWQANHDVGETGWSETLLTRFVTRYQDEANIIISSEQNLGEQFSRFLYRGKVSDIHHLMAFCDVVVGESATMASEAAVLGVPAIYAAQTGRGYTDEQEDKYELVKNVRQLNWQALEEAMDSILGKETDYYKAARERLLSSTIDVAEYVADTLSAFPDMNHIAAQSGV